MQKVRIPKRYIALLVAALVAVIPTAASASTSAMPIGLYKANNSGNYPFPTTPKYAIQYYGWGEGFQTADAQQAWSNKTELFVELQTCGNPCNSSTSTPVSNITNGSSDTYLKNFAGQIKTFNHPVLVTFDHEMNGNWYPWGSSEVTPTQWIAAWQHVTTLINSVASNITWVWAPNIESGATSVSKYWPGNGFSKAHVDWVGLDGYYRNNSANWSNTFSKSVSDVKALSGTRTFIVAETGVNSADSNRVSQIDNLVSGARNANAKAIMYFDKDGTLNWYFTSAMENEFIKDTK